MRVLPRIPSGEEPRVASDVDSPRHLMPAKRAIVVFSTVTCLIFIPAPAASRTLPLAKARAVVLAVAKRYYAKRHFGIDRRSVRCFRNSDHVVECDFRLRRGVRNTRLTGQMVVDYPTDRNDRVRILRHLVAMRRSAIAERVVIPAATPDWLVARARVQAMILHDPHPRLVRIQLGFPYAIELKGAFVCDMCSRLSATPLMGTRARITYDPKTRLQIEFAFSEDGDRR